MCKAILKCIRSNIALNCSKEYIVFSFQSQDKILKKFYCKNKVTRFTFRHTTHLFFNSIQVIGTRIKAYSLIKVLSFLTTGAIIILERACSTVFRAFHTILLG